MTESLQCWRCGASLASLSLPLSRQDQCPDCSVYLHNCRMCSFFDPAVVEQCREDDAEEVKNKEGANFCDYFRPNPTAHDARYVSAEGQARSQLESLLTTLTLPDRNRVLRKRTAIVTPGTQMLKTCFADAWLLFIDHFVGSNATTIRWCCTR